MHNLYTKIKILKIMNKYTSRVTRKMTRYYRELEQGKSSESNWTDVSTDEKKYRRECKIRGQIYLASLDASKDIISWYPYPGQDNDRVCTLCRMWNTGDPECKRVNWSNDSSTHVLRVHPPVHLLYQITAINNLYVHVISPYRF